MREIPLTQGKTALVDDVDFEWLSRWNWYAQRVERGNRVVYYARRHRPGGGAVRMHREIAGITGMEVDHRDGNGLNNQRSNLRTATGRQNSQNRRKSAGCTSRFKGVSWHRLARKWQVHIKFGSHRRYLGLFDDQIEAARAYDAASRAFFGSFALTNKQLTKKIALRQAVAVGSKQSQQLR